MAKNKPQKLKARLPRGFVDRDAAEIHALEAMLERIKKVYELYGFDPIETPMFEYTDALGKFLPDADRPNEGVFSLLDDDEQWLSLRYDLTAPLARYVAENYEALPKPFRSYRAGYVFRNEKPGPGRFRQFMQFDADAVGAPGPSADAEMCMMMADAIEAAGIPRGDYVIRVNNRKVLDGVMEAIGLSGEEKAGKRLAVLRAIDKLDKFGIEGVRQLLGEGRKDESGDFTKGAGLDSDQIDKIISVIAASKAHVGTPNLVGVVQNDEITFFDKTKEGEEAFEYVKNGWTIADLRDAVDGSSLAEDGVRELEQIYEMCNSCGYKAQRIKIDPSVVRGLEYYTGTVFECELTFETVNEKGEKARFGSVAGGGRYDGLVSRFGTVPTPATGFSIGVSRLMAALKNLGKLDDARVTPPVIVCVMDRDVEALGQYQRFAQELRAAKIRAEMFQGNPKQFGKQLQYADRRDAIVAVIQGSEERERGVVQLKDLRQGREEAKAIEDRATWVAERPGQVEVPAERLVEEVRAILARYEGGGA